MATNGAGRRLGSGLNVQPGLVPQHQHGNASPTLAAVVQDWMFASESASQNGTATITGVEVSLAVTAPAGSGTAVAVAVGVEVLTQATAPAAFAAATAVLAGGEIPVEVGLPGAVGGAVALPSGTSVQTEAGSAGAQGEGATDDTGPRVVLVLPRRRAKRRTPLEIPRIAREGVAFATGVEVSLVAGPVLATGTASAAPQGLVLDLHVAGVTARGAHNPTIEQLVVLLEEAA